MPLAHGVACYAATYNWNTLRILVDLLGQRGDYGMIS